jgi:hypothetical protein
MDNWISINKVPPPLMKDLIVCNEYRVSVAYHNDRKWVFYFSPLTHITHWQLLPTLPKKEITIVNELYLNKFLEEDECWHIRFAYKNVIADKDISQCFDCGMYFNLLHPKNEKLKEDLIKAGYGNENINCK